MIKSNASNPEFRVPTSVPLHNYNNLCAIRDGSIALGGAATAIAALKYLLEGITEARIKEEIKPSTQLQKRLRANTTELSDMAVPLEKEGGLCSPGVDAAQSVHNFVCNTSAKKPDGEPFVANINNINKNNEPGTVVYKPGTGRANLPSVSNAFLLSDSPLRAPILLPILATASIATVPYVADKLVKYLSESVMEKPKHKSNYTEKAKEVYREALKDLKKEKEKNTKEAKWSWSGLKNAGAKIMHGAAPDEYVVSNPGNPLYTLSPVMIMALLGSGGIAYLLYRASNKFKKGVKDAENDVSLQQHYVHGWKAREQMRDYNYMPMYVTQENEPLSSAQKKDKKVKRVLDSLSDIESDKGIKDNPFTVAREVNDATDLRY